MTKDCSTNDNKTQIPAAWCQVVEGELTLHIPKELHYLSSAILEDVESLVLEGLLKFHDGDNKIIKPLQLTFEAYKIPVRGSYQRPFHNYGLVLIIISILAFSVIVIFLGVTRTKNRTVTNNTNNEEENRGGYGIQLSDDASTHFEEGMMNVMEFWARKEVTKKSIIT